jgi:polyphosphate kinase 2 (PPK2 family)
MVILDRSWYRHVIDDAVEGTVQADGVQRGLQDINDFERMLADDRTAIVKFFLHISKKEQKSRFKKMAKDPLESWRVTKDDWRRHRRYEGLATAIDRAIAATDSEFAPWTIVEGTSRWWARRKVFETLIAALEYHLGDQAPQSEAVSQSTQHDAELRAAMATLEARGGEA